MRAVFGAIAGAISATVTDTPPVPRIVRHNLHPFMRRLYGKVIAGGASGGGGLVQCLTVACIALVALMSGAAEASPEMLGLAVVGSTKLVELRTKLDTKRAELREAFDLAGPDMDFSQKPILDHLGAKDSAEAVEKVRALNKEIEEIHDEAKPLAELENMKTQLDHVGRINQTNGDRVVHAHPAHIGRPRAAGDVLVEDDGFDVWAKNRGGGDVDINITMAELRRPRATLFETGAGWDPEDIRIGRVVDAVTRPIQVLDIIPLGRTTNSTVKYMLETTRTHAAAEKAEGAAFAESTFVLAEQTSEVRKITDSIPVTDEQLEDVPMVQSYLNQRLTFGLRQRLDGQVLTGDGIAPNIDGIINVAGIQTHAKGSDSVPDAVYTALTKVRVTGRSFPDFCLFHHNDWQDVRLLQTADGIYIWGSPAMAGPERIWGLPVVQTDALTENTGLVGDFGNFCMIFERRGVDVQVGYSGTQFVEGKRTIRADLRAAFVVFRPAAFATVTGI